MLEKRKNNSDYLFLYIGFISFVYLWDVKFELFQARFLILIIFIPLIYKLIKDLKNSNYSSLKLSSFIILFLFLHLFINLFYDNAKLDYNILFSYIFFSFIILVSVYFNNNFSEILEKSLILFLFLFLISSSIGILLKLPDAPFFCGGIPDVFSFFTHSSVDPGRVSSSPYKVSFSELLFKENSHLGMVAPGVLAYGIYIVSEKKISNIVKLLILIFAIVCFIKSSTTLIVGVILSIIIINLFNFDKIKKKTQILFATLLIVFSLSFINSDECKYRIFVLEYDNKDFDINKYNKEIKNQNEISYIKKNYIRIYNIIKAKLELDTFLSSSIYLNNLRITLISIKDRPFGWGLNRYSDAFEFYNKMYPPINKRVGEYNIKDGSNNLFKIIVEFGVFSIVFFFYLINYLFNTKISIGNKLFYLPIILTQLIRGAGYFNGGFALIICIMVFQLINIKK